MKKKLHMIGNAHLDSVWLWRWQEGFGENKATIKSMLDILDEYDEAIFTTSSAQLYQWLEENNKTLFERVKKKIKEGRVVVCGGWWIQPDCNLPSGEAFARHSLIGQNYFYDAFGVISKTGYCVDSFGHNAMLPQLLKKSRMDGYLFMRPQPSEKTDLPDEVFVWESPDGSRVKTARIPFTYCARYLKTPENDPNEYEDLNEHIKRCKTLLEKNPASMPCFYGVGNHGGGPTRDCVKTIKTQKGENLLFSSPDDLFLDIDEKDLKTYKGDLQHHAVGCYSVHSQIKKLNRKAENALLSAEKFSILASFLKKADYPKNLTDAWKQLLFQQFHDILAGTSIEEAYVDAFYQLGEAFSIAQRGENNALQAISFDINIPFEENAIPIVVFNPHSWSVFAQSEIETGFFEEVVTEETMSLVCEGENIRFQSIESEAKVNKRQRIAFCAEIPPLGYKTFVLKSGGRALPKLSEKESFSLENDYLKVEFSEKTGCINQIYDKKSGLSYLSNPISVVLLEDFSDTWSHGEKGYNKTAGSFTPYFIKKTENGAVRSVIRTKSRFENSVLIQDFILYSNKAQIEVRTTLNLWEKHRCIKLSIPFDGEKTSLVTAMPFGNITHACDGLEQPMQEWASIWGEKNGEKLGLAVLNDGKYGVDAKNQALNITLSRTPIYAHHTPFVPKADEEYSYIDQGKQQFIYTLVPCKGEAEENFDTLHKKAAELNQGCPLVVEAFHEGDLPTGFCVLSVSCENVIVSALKKAEKSDDYILRFYESAGKNAKGEIKLFENKIPFELKPYEIKTLALGKELVEVDFLEWNINMEV